MPNKLEKSMSPLILKTLIEGDHNFKVMNYQDESIIHIANEAIVQKFTREDSSPLNVFIKNIRMSTADGKIFFFDKNDKGVLSPFKEKIVICAETTANNEIFEIDNDDFRLLLRFYPDMIMDDDGMLMFSIGQMIALTYDCKTIIIIRPEQVHKNATAFVSRFINSDGNIVIEVAVGNGFGEGEYIYYEIIPMFSDFDSPLITGVHFEPLGHIND